MLYFDKSSRKKKNLEYYIYTYILASRWFCFSKLSLRSSLFQLCTRCGTFFLHLPLDGIAPAALPSCSASSLRWSLWTQVQRAQSAQPPFSIQILKCTPCSTWAQMYWVLQTHDGLHCWVAFNFVVRLQGDSQGAERGAVAQMRLGERELLHALGNTWPELG